MGETREQTAGKYLTSAIEAEKKDGGKWRITVVKKGQVEFLHRGLAAALHNWHLIWHSLEDCISAAYGQWFDVWCGEVLQGGTWAIPVSEEKKRQQQILLLA